MPKIVSPNSTAAISTALKAGYYRLIGLEITVAPGVTKSWAVVSLGTADRSRPPWTSCRTT